MSDSSRKRARSASSGQIAPPPVPPPPRTRERHDLSDGESESGDPTILYRALRKEESPRSRGLLPPVGANPDVTASQHITAGSRAKEKSSWISATRSRKVAGAWATESGDGRVVKFRKPAGQQTFDMTNPEQARLVFPAMEGSSLNSAKASQEVLIKDRVPKGNIMEVYDVRRATVAGFKEARANPPPGMVAAARSRTKVKNSSGKKTAPRPFLFFRQQKK